MAKREQQGQNHELWDSTDVTGVVTAGAAGAAFGAAFGWVGVAAGALIGAGAAAKGIADAGRDLHDGVINETESDG